MDTYSRVLHLRKISSYKSILLKKTLYNFRKWSDPMNHEPKTQRKTISSNQIVQQSTCYKHTSAIKPVQAKYYYYSFAPIFF